MGKRILKNLTRESYLILYKKIQKITLIVSILFFFVISNCTLLMNAGSKSGFVTFKIGGAQLVRTGSAPKEIILKDEILQGDLLVTGENSALVVQFGEACLIRLDQKSSYKVAVVAPDYLEIFLQNGLTFNRLDQNNRIKLFFKTLNTFASIRGTTFSVSYGNGVSRVTVSDGTVNVSATRHNAAGEAVSPAGKEVPVNAGAAVVIAETAQKGVQVLPPLKMKFTRISQRERTGLRKIGAMPIIPDIEKTDVRQVEEIQKDVLEKEKEIDSGKGSGIDREELNKLIANKNRTLNEIRQVFDGVDEVTLHNGRVINGAILSRGEVFRILTPNGIISVPKSDIKNLIKK